MSEALGGPIRRHTVPGRNFPGLLDQREFRRLDRRRRRRSRLGSAARRARSLRARLRQSQPQPADAALARMRKDAPARLRSDARRRRQRLVLVVRARAPLGERRGFRRSLPQAPHRNLQRARRAGARKRWRIPSTALRSANAASRSPLSSTSTSTAARAATSNGWAPDSAPPTAAAAHARPAVRAGRFLLRLQPHAFLSARRSHSRGHLRHAGFSDASHHVGFPRNAHHLRREGRKSSPSPSSSRAECAC